MNRRDASPREDTASRDARTEDPENFKRTPPAEEIDRDPLDSGRRLNSNQLLVGSLVVGVLLGLVLALVYP